MMASAGVIQLMPHTEAALTQLTESASQQTFPSATPGVLNLLVKFLVEPFRDYRETQPT
jgi:hypothetical protein